MIFVKLILAHLLGDFVLQPDRWVHDKELRKLRSPFLYLHVGLHIALCYLILWDFKLWWVPLIVGGTHFFIDAAKLQFQKKSNQRAWFFGDQLLHIFVLVIVSAPFLSQNIWPVLFDQKMILLYTVLVFLTIPCSIIIKILLSTWVPPMSEVDGLETDSLISAGKYIGILERLMVFVFIALNHWEGVGFMIAAKSAFRFTDLQKAKQRKLTEYVLIGTLLSFGLAMATGILFEMMTK